jgi:hypothetical protein
MDHPEAPSAPPLKGRHQRPGKAGSAVALGPRPSPAPCIAETERA